MAKQKRPMAKDYQSYNSKMFMNNPTSITTQFLRHLRFEKDYSIASNGMTFA